MPNDSKHFNLLRSLKVVKENRPNKTIGAVGLDYLLIKGIDHKDNFTISLSCLLSLPLTTIN
jgi:hypothetical protein